ncbi:cytochrome c [Thalassospira sp.]|uniref:cytochrome c n=1 Tax=Thalassospira sp. TaxID=1912094 RepID=UPI00273577A6|nr:cytochrome c [Thalassospira sp.]MDP2697902.1 cytochrome c [Thalassospira sp.]
MATTFRDVMIGVVAMATLGGSINAAELTITAADGSIRTHDTEQFLSSPALQTIVIENDIGYGRIMTYQAVPLVSLIPDHDAVDDQTGLQVLATDGYAANLPLPLVIQDGDDGARAWLAIEPQDAKWPNLPGKDVSAGPFSVVWSNQAAFGIMPQQWPYQVASLSYAPFPATRWPQLALADGVTDAARRGQTVFVDQCLVCHRMNVAGLAALGPDLNIPMNPTQYFQPAALALLIRDPAQVRQWPDMQMHGFDPVDLSDSDIDDVVAYLAAMAETVPE